MSNTDDRKLLEDAARALGLKHKTVDGVVYVLRHESPKGDWHEFNTLYDDGDCHRMEERKKLTIAWEPMKTEWRVGAIVGDEFKWLASDPDRKRASTMCVAAIGRSM